MKYLTYYDRKIIEKLLRQKMSYRAIGRSIGRSHTTISDEINLNSGQLGYSAERAQYYHEQKQLNKGNRKKFDTNERLREYVIEKLKKDWSPEEISGRLKEYPDEEIGYVCHETIYAYIYSIEVIRQKLYLLLRRYKPKRTKWHSRKKRCSGIKERISIHERPSVIDEKIELGHWETDSMIFSQQKGILSVQVERKTKLVRIHKCPNKTAEETLDAIIDTIDSVPLKYFLSVTYDNGTEGAKHMELKNMFGVATYFCDPYCSWQKGLVENTNMFIRQYLPKNAPIDSINDEEIYEVQENLNNRPRKCLKYMTPNEYFNSLT